MVPEVADLLWQGVDESRSLNIPFVPDTCQPEIMAHEINEHTAMTPKDDESSLLKCVLFDGFVGFFCDRSFFGATSNRLSASGFKGQFYCGRVLGDALRRHLRNSACIQTRDSLGVGHVNAAFFSKLLCKKCALWAQGMLVVVLNAENAENMRNKKHLPVLRCS